VLVGLVVYVSGHLLGIGYLFFAGYTILQFIVLASAWNILGGYCGYVNFGSAAFFALGAYSTVFFYKFNPLPIPILIIIAAVVSGIVGFGMGYLTLRLRGAFFAIATLAMAVVLQTLVVNWSYVGGSRGAYIVRADTVDIGGYTIEYIEYLFLLMMAVFAASIRSQWMDPRPFPVSTVFIAIQTSPFTLTGAVWETGALLLSGKMFGSGCGAAK